MSPASHVAITLGEAAGAVVWCDGRRTMAVPPGARDRGDAAAQRLRFARVHARPFTDRLVAKFDLPVEGWRRARARGAGIMIEYLRIRDLGVIAEADLELSGGLVAVTGETGAGKTMIMTALDLLFGGKANPGSSARARAAREGRRGSGSRTRRALSRAARPRPR